PLAPAGRLVDPGEQEATLGHRGVGRPHLLARDEPAAVGPNRAGPKCGEVRAGPRLAEPLAPDHLTPGDRREMAGLLVWGAVPHDRRADPVEPHVLCATRFMRDPHLFTQRGLLPDVRARAAVLLGPRHRQEVTLAQLTTERLGDLEVGGVVGEGPQESRGHVLVDQPAQLGAELRYRCWFGEVEHDHLCDVDLLIYDKFRSPDRPERERSDYQSYKGLARVAMT